jgi:serum/glucocorticoid-regulated kinase 2
VIQLSPKLQDLLKKMLIKDPSKRLGHNGAEEIQQHAWFDKLSWEGNLSKKLKAPFVPKLSSDIDLNNFDTDFTSCSL